MSVNSKGIGETGFMCRLAGAFAGRLCDKCPFSHVLAHIGLRNTYMNHASFYVTLIKLFVDFGNKLFVVLFSEW